MKHKLCNVLSPSGLTSSQRLSATLFLTFVTLIYPPGPISHPFSPSPTCSYDFIKEWQTDRSSQMSIWGESQGRSPASINVTVRSRWAPAGILTPQLELQMDVTLLLLLSPTLSACSRAPSAVTFPETQWVSLTGAAVKIYFQSFNLQHFNNVSL